MIKQIPLLAAAVCFIASSSVFRSGSDTNLEPGKGSGYRDRKPIGIPIEEEDPSSHACRRA
jgi:hypothetical protein